MAPSQHDAFRGESLLVGERIITSVLCVYTLMAIDYRFISQDPPVPKARLRYSLAIRHRPCQDLRSLPSRRSAKRRPEDLAAGKTRARRQSRCKILRKICCSAQVQP
jgi:hypothetical protein